MENNSAFRTGLGKNYGPDDLLSMWFEEIHKFPILSQNEERRLIRLWQECGDIQARDKVIHHNLQFATWLAKKFSNRGAEDLDLIQEATIGLIVAIDKFDLNLPFNFISCASWCIKLHIYGCIKNSNNSVYISKNLYALIVKIKNIKKKLYHEFERWPSAEEISDETKIPLKKVTDALVIINREFISLNSPIYENKDGEQTPFSSIVKGPCPSPETMLLAREEAKKIREEIKKIKHLLNNSSNVSKKQRLIFFLRYGLETDGNLQEIPLEEVGKNPKIKITREAVRQNVERIWHKLHRAGIPKINNHDWLTNVADRLTILNEA